MGAAAGLSESEDPTRLDDLHREPFQGVGKPPLVRLLDKDLDRGRVFARKTNAGCYDPGKREQIAGMSLVHLHGTSEPRGRLGRSGMDIENPEECEQYTP